MPAPMSGQLIKNKLCADCCVTEKLFREIIHMARILLHIVP